MSKAVAFLAVAILIGVVILSVSIRGQLAEKRRLADEFVAAQQTSVREAAADLAREWRQLDEDGRLVATLASQMSGDRIRARASTPAMYESFRSLATVVRYYRCIAFAPRGKGPSLSAVDPTEKPEMAKWLLDRSLSAGSLVADGGSHFDGPVRAPDGREFLFYTTAVESLGSVVLAAELPLLLQRILRPRALENRYIVLDGGGGLWMGCDGEDRCVRRQRSDWQGAAFLPALVDILRRNEAGTARTKDDLAVAIGIKSGKALLAWQAFRAGSEKWTLAALVSQAALEERESHLIWRLIWTSVALAISLGGIGLLGIREQRRHAALNERVRLMQHEARLREQTERIIDSVPAGIVGITSDGRVASINRFLRARFASVRLGVSLDEAFSEAGGHESARQLRGMVDEAVRVREPITLPQPLTDRLCGQPNTFEMRAVPIDDPARQISALVLVEDFSELRRLERQLVRAEKLATVGVLTAGIAHEIGTPLGIIRVRVETFLESTVSREHRNLESILGQIDRISTTIRQLLDFSREQPVLPRPTEVCAVARNAGELLDWRFRQKNLGFAISATDPSLSVAADPDQLQQVFVNLLMNACDACRDGGRIEVTVARERRPHDPVRIEVRDNGCGIPPDQINAVFDPFFTTKKRGEGTGLGLAVVASIVRNHGGQITIASEPARGTVVIIQWPAPERETAHA